MVRVYVYLRSNSLQVLGDSFGLVVVASYRVGSCQDGSAGGETAHNACLGNTDALLLLGSRVKRSEFTSTPYIDVP